MQPAAEATVSVDATVYHLATPDIVNMNVSCEAPAPGSKAEVRAAFRDITQRVVSVAGSDAAVRRNGPPTVYQYYGPDPLPPIGALLYGGTLNLSVLGIQNGAHQRISDAVEEMGCTLTWDVRFLQTVRYARDMHDELFAQINEKRRYFEELLGIALINVSNIYVNTSPDTGGYYGSTSFDPETGTLPAATVLSITYDIGTGKPQK